MQSTSNLTEGKLAPKILTFTLPIILTNFLQLLFNTADTLVVGRWGGDTAEACETALAAVGSCGSLVNLIVNFFIGLAIGAGVLVAQDVGAGNMKDVDRVIHTSIALSSVLGVAVMAIGVHLARPMLTLMGTDPAVLDEATPYLVAYFCGAPANLTFNFCAAILRSQGNSKSPLLYLSIAGVGNVILNLVMVLGFRLGAVGVGIATAAAQWIACILVLRYLASPEREIRLDFRRVRFDFEKIRRICHIGIPAGLQSTCFAFSNVLIQSSVNSFGKAAMAGNAAAGNLVDYIYIAQHSFYEAAITFSGQSYGARKFDRLRKSAFWCVLYVILISFLVSLPMLALGRQLLALYAPENPDVVDYGMIKLKLFCWTYFLCGLMEVGSGILRGIGKSMVSTTVSLVGSCVFRVVWIYTVFRWSPSPEILYASYPVTWIITSCAHFSFALPTIRKQEREFLRKQSLKGAETYEPRATGGRDPSGRI